MFRFERPCNSSGLSWKSSWMFCLMCSGLVDLGKTPVSVILVSSYTHFLLHTFTYTLCTHFIYSHVVRVGWFNKPPDNDVPMITNMFNKSAHHYFSGEECVPIKSITLCTREMDSSPSLAQGPMWRLAPMLLYFKVSKDIPMFFFSSMRKGNLRVLWKGAEDSCKNITITGIFPVTYMITKGWVIFLEAYITSMRKRQFGSSGGRWGGDIGRTPMNVKERMYGLFLQHVASTNRCLAEWPSAAAPGLGTGWTSWPHSSP